MHDDEMKIEPARLRSLRERRAWSQEQLAEIAGLSVRTVQRVEASGVASLDTRMALASALEVGPAELLDRAAGASGPSGAESHDTVLARAARYGLLALLVFVLALILVQRMGTSSGAANRARTATAPDVAR